MKHMTYIQQQAVNKKNLKSGIFMVSIVIALGSVLFTLIVKQIN